MTLSSEVLTEVFTMYATYNLNLPEAITCSTFGDKSEKCTRNIKIIKHSMLQLQITNINYTRLITTLN